MAKKKLAAWLMVLGFISSGSVIAGPLMYVPTGEANDVIVIDPNTDKILSRIGDLENTHGLAGSAKSEYLVAGSMKLAEPPASSVTAKPVVGAAETPIIPLSYVSIIHPKHGHVTRRVAVRGITHHTAVSPDGQYAIAVHAVAGGVSVIDIERAEVVKEIQTGRSPNFAVFNIDGTRLYVSNVFSGTVSEINTSDWSLMRSIDVGREPEHMVLSPDGSQLFVINVGDKQAVEVDMKTATVIKRYTVGSQAHGLALSADGSVLFASSQGDGKLVSINLRDGTQRAPDLVPAPYHVEYVGIVNKLYVSSRKAPKIWVIDPQSLTVRGEIAIGQGVAHQMVILDQ